MSQETYVRQLADVMRSDADVYRTIAVDLHTMGVYLQRHKYRFLRFSTRSSSLRS